MNLIALVNVEAYEGGISDRGGVWNVSDQLGKTRLGGDGEGVLVPDFLDGRYVFPLVSLALAPFEFPEMERLTTGLEPSVFTPDFFGGEVGGFFSLFKPVARSVTSFAESFREAFAALRVTWGFASSSKFITSIPSSHVRLFAPVTVLTSKALDEKNDPQANVFIEIDDWMGFICSGVVPVGGFGSVPRESASSFTTSAAVFTAECSRSTGREVVDEEPYQPHGEYHAERGVRAKSAERTDSGFFLDDKVAFPSIVESLPGDPAASTTCIVDWVLMGRSSEADKNGVLGRSIGGSTSSLGVLEFWEITSEAPDLDVNGK
jgi:hypothetical protein